MYVAVVKTRAECGSETQLKSQNFFFCNNIITIFLEREPPSAHEVDSLFKLAQKKLPQNKNQ